MVVDGAATVGTPIRLAPSVAAFHKVPVPVLQKFAHAVHVPVINDSPARGVLGQCYVVIFGLWYEYAFVFGCFAETTQNNFDSTTLPPACWIQLTIIHELSAQLSAVLVITNVSSQLAMNRIRIPEARGWLAGKLPRYWERYGVMRYGGVGGESEVCAWGEECDVSWHRESGLRDDIREDNSWMKIATTEYMADPPTQQYLKQKASKEDVVPVK
ncbi:hypothetical protein F4604DRAFT_1692587 [Suillus subluteus]|nr:hypothetical protein F4604DRAFT_1692587 [Suillus subluteus]